MFSILHTITKYFFQENKVISKTVYMTLQEVYEASGDFKQADHFALNTLNVSSEIFEVDKQKVISELEIKFETTKEESEKYF